MNKEIVNLLETLHDEMINLPSENDQGDLKDFKVKLGDVLEVFNKKLPRNLQEKKVQVVGDELRIVYRNKEPYGIRDRGGYLFFFSSRSEYQGQEERYKREIEQQHRLADFLLDVLKGESK